MRSVAQGLTKPGERDPYKESESLTVFIQGDSVFLGYWLSDYASATGGKDR
jgi:hypothetical protein